MIVNRVLKFSELRREVPSTNSGSRIVDQYKLQFNDDGSKELVVCGKKDIYMEIQSHAESVDIHNIIERCMVTGDPSPLYKTRGFYGDIADMPSTRAEALQMLADAESLWKQLPKEVKEKFDNDVSKFFASAFTDEWSSKLGFMKEEVKEEDKKEVVENE